uniref:NADH-ubiquinone oxidoreductase chain 2 n=1 Tax=Tyraphus nitidus TaxID=2973947 RepID=A0A976UFX3_9COLE|nr:NADH dehydrogenase subunit 2 [Tyraphus nitidus]UVG40764.1 NADH dehydrogenase subunit 2 [Tyraphus nitidus]
MFYSNKFIFLSLILMSTMISVSSNSWLGMWLGLEVNLLSIIPLMNNIKNLYSSESSMKYFIMQAMASASMLISIIFMNSMEINFQGELKSLIFTSAMLTKMGAAPFHFWFPEVMEGLDWMVSLIMLTWQKIAPMVILSYLSWNSLMNMTILFSCLIGGLMGINQISLRKIIAYSSITHMGWMIAAMMFNSIWIWYWIIYSFMTMNLIMILNMTKIYNTNQMNNLFSKSKMFKISLSLNILSMGGLPPFIGFIPKWFTIQLLINNKLYWLSLVLIITTLATLFFYIRLIIPSFSLNLNEIKMNFDSYKFMFIANWSNMFNMLGMIFCTLTYNFI